MKEMIPICDKCGKTAPVDEKMSTASWVVYKIKEPCKCGGKFAPKFIAKKTKKKATTDK